MKNAEMKSIIVRASTTKTRQWPSGWWQYNFLADHDSNPFGDEFLVSHQVDLYLNFRSWASFHWTSILRASTTILLKPSLYDQANDPITNRT